ncbi:hypothetical protein E2C01_001205 [Portunus trituberculatus]|uniref:Secreted protein n=1 Tax=Portunus trituberculatus TaxID=210409 RepID=A0A5B7CJV1_PORTR|nr:hypothetical protein [Portunus trituberculatus]
MFPAAATARFLYSLVVWLPSPCGAVPGHPFGVFGRAPCCASPVYFQDHDRKLHALPQTERHQHLQAHFVCTGSRDALPEPLGETPEFENSPASPESHPEVREAAQRPALRTMGLDSGLHSVGAACNTWLTESPVRNLPLYHPAVRGADGVWRRLATTLLLLELLAQRREARLTFCLRLGIYAAFRKRRGSSKQPVHLRASR